MKRGSDWEPLDLKGIKTRSLWERKSKVEVTRFASPLSSGSTFKGFFDSHSYFGESIPPGNIGKFLRVQRIKAYVNSLDPGPGQCFAPGMVVGPSHRVPLEREHPCGMLPFLPTDHWHGIRI